MNAPFTWTPGKMIGFVFGCGCTLFFLLFGGTVALGVFTLNNEGAMGGTGSTGPISEDLSDFVPPNYAALFTEAETLTKAPAALIATVFMNEHHNDTGLGTDLASLDAIETPCEDYPPYVGPMQMHITDAWGPQIAKLQAAGITNPDYCKYRDSFIAAGFLLYQGKLQNAWAKPACLTDGGELTLTDDCVYKWAQSYCGASEEYCRVIGKGCSNSTWTYCEKAVEIFHMITGT